MVDGSRWRWLPTVAGVAGGGLLGISGLAPDAWPLAWAGVVATSWALTVERSAARSVLALVVGGVLIRAFWFGWSPDMARAMWPDGPTALYTVGFVLVESLPVVATLAVLARLFHGRPGWVKVWLPLGWVVAERLQADWTSVSSDWVFTQVDCAPIMDALGAWGLIVTTWLCLFVAASFGEALALRRWNIAGGVAALVLLGLAPPLPAGDPGLLAGIGVVHMPDGFHLPVVDRVDADLKVVVWPETILNAQPALKEGRHQTWHLDAAPGGPGTWHLVGAQTPPRYGSQNMALSVAPDGAVTQARAKSVLMPVFERPFLGLGRDDLIPGDMDPVVEAAEVPFIPLLCGEVLHRELVAAGVRAGGKVLAVMARDKYQGGSTLADRHVLTVLRLRAIEGGVPAVYASLGGRATIVSARGEVLARSAPGAEAGVLTWSPARGAEDHSPQLVPPVTVLYSRKAPAPVPDCPPGYCAYIAIEDARCPREAAATLVVSAHGDGERIGGLEPQALATVVACLHPKLVVLDACYGASAPVLKALGEHTDALIVAVPAFLAARGFRYGAAFFSDLPAEERAAAIATHPPSPLYVGRPDPAAMSAVEGFVSTADGDTLRPLVRSWVPTLVAVNVDPSNEVLVPADWRRIGHPPEL